MVDVEVQGADPRRQTDWLRVSPGCEFCYAEAFAERFRNVPGDIALPSAAPISALLLVYHESGHGGLNAEFSDIDNMSDIQIFTSDNVHHVK